MANTQTIQDGDSSAALYKSNYTTRKVTLAQFLAEKMCERQAKRDKLELVDQFWNTVRWKRAFLWQVQLANGLLKLYQPEAILAALRKNPTIYSLNAKFLDPLIQHEQETLVRKNDTNFLQENTISPTPADVNAKPRSTFIDKQSPLAKLRNL